MAEAVCYSNEGPHRYSSDWVRFVAPEFAELQPLSTAQSSLAFSGARMYLQVYTLSSPLSRYVQHVYQVRVKHTTGESFLPFAY